MANINMDWEQWKEINANAMKYAHWRKLEPHELDILRRALHSNGIKHFNIIVFNGGKETVRVWKILLKLRNMGLFYFTLNENYELHHFKRNEWLKDVVDQQWEKHMKWEEQKQILQRNRNDTYKRTID